MYKRLNRREAPFRIKLFWYLASFFLFVILLLWVLQVVFMDSFYRSVTSWQMKKNASVLAGAVVSSGDVDHATYEASTNLGACVSVYRIKDGTGSMLSEAHARNGCFIHGLVSSDALTRIYNETRDGGGEVSVELFGDGPAAKDNSSILYSRIVKNRDAEYLLLFNTESFPVGSTAATITAQLSLITVILIIGAAVLAIVISRKITRPVWELSREAEELAVGDYKVTFTEGDIEELNRLGHALGYAAAELEKSNAIQRELVANVTHDLRTPLTLISGYGEVMRDIPGEVTPENIQVIIDESARLSALVNDVLEVSKAQNGAMTLNITEFSLTDAVSGITGRYAEMLKGQGYTVIYDWDGIEVRTSGDETKLMQAFCNLLNNAVNFTGADKHIFVRQYVHGGVCRTEVTDTGDGISADMLESIWDRYYRARDRHSKGVPGSGLGLSIVKQVMLLHDASFGVMSTPGKGSTFWFEMRVL